ncbi:MAG TPA: 1-deoxy-D-xylulose-5-phosphate synthase N-terminal domain-containing protein, partial [Chitinophagaceae bacterium]|nr:1-deoxy-D-xylulose-5-phosphate synthase N-terminal domain-containing protein [Chitinophagaceae bacterium]
MIPSSGTVNIPVEDKSYKWSKKNIKSRIPTPLFVFINNYGNLSQLPTLKMYFCTLINVMEIKPGELLSQINSPGDLKKLSRKKLHQLSDELRQYIIDTVSVHGGHFGASLGT